MTERECPNGIDWCGGAPQRSADGSRSGPRHTCGECQADRIDRVYETERDADFMRWQAGLEDDQ